MSKTFEEKALEIAALMEDSKGQNVTVLDISQLNSWTDFFVIVTVSSGVQSQGMLKAVKDYAKENDLEIDEPIGQVFSAVAKLLGMKL